MTAILKKLIKSSMVELTMATKKQLPNLLKNSVEMKKITNLFTLTAID